MNGLDWIGAITILWVLPAWFCWAEGKKKNRLGLAYGICLSWLGVLVLSLMGPARETG